MKAIEDLKPFKIEFVYRDEQGTIVAIGGWHSRTMTWRYSVEEAIMWMDEGARFYVVGKAEDGSKTMVNIIIVDDPRGR